MPIYEDNTPAGIEGFGCFNFSELDFSISKPVQVCAFEFIKNKSNCLQISNVLKNVGCLGSESVNLFTNSMKEYKYLAKFDNILIQAMVPFDDDKYLAVASIDQLKQYLPSNINLDVNKDLMGIAFDAFVVNRGNKNGHIIGTDVALSMVENFINKPFNIEHNRKIVVGVCTGYGFSEFGSSKPLSRDQIENTKDPFNVVLSGYIWKIVNPEFAEEMLNSSDPSSDKYLSVSASWELGFNEFNIAKGSKNLAESIIIEDTEEILSLKDNLRVFGGNGFSKEGESLFLNLKGSVLPLGIGFTNTPAAEVAGVLVNKIEAPEKQEEEQKKSNSSEFLDFTNKKSVQEENKNVKKTMEIKNIDDITEDSMKDIQASAVRDFISTRITDLSKEWKLKIEEKENSLKDVEAKHKDLETLYAETLTALNALKLEFSALQSDIQKKEVEATFQNRMASLDEDFDLTDEDRSIIAEDLQANASDEDFAKWFKKFSTFAAAKKKSLKVNNVRVEANENNDQVVQTKSLVKEEASIEEVVSSVKQEIVNLPNVLSPQEHNLVDKINAAFNRNSIKIK
jgi:hypothetical protein